MSQLLGIITRLQKLQENQDQNEPAQRNFEVNGEKICSVKYFDQTKIFELTVFKDNNKPTVYQFDDIDMIAIEVFDLLG